MDEREIAEVVALALGRSVRCRALRGASSGRVFLLSDGVRRWIAKFFPEDEKPVVMRTIAVLHALASRGTRVPHLFCREPLILSSMYGYLYEYVEGICARGLTQDVELWRTGGYAIARLTVALKESWVNGFLPCEFKSFDLEEELWKGHKFVAQTFGALAKEVEKLVSRKTYCRSGSEMVPLHADLHMGNLISTRSGLVPIDFDSMCLGLPEKAWASMVGKAYEIPGASRAHIAALVEAAIEGGKCWGFSLDRDVLRLFTLQKKIGELQYIEGVRRSFTTASACKHRRDAARGLSRLLREWDDFPARVFDLGNK